MASRLVTLASNLITPNFSKLREISKVFTSEDMPFITWKGVYLYEYTDSWEKLEETSLPSKEGFHSTLGEYGITDEDFKHAVTVWKHFGCGTYGEYSDLYLKVNVMLLTVVFENIHDICLTTYNLNPEYYYTAPGFSFDGILKHRK